MSFFSPFRRRVPAATAAALVLLSAMPAFAQPPKGGLGTRGPALRVQTPRAAQPKQPKQEHLSQWMERHRDLSPAEKQKALESEPGFRDLSPDAQQRLRDSLTKLNNMPPEQRQRMLARTEAMEHLTPQQRTQVRSALGQLGSLPEERRRMVARAFRDLREMPEPQRQTILNSDRFRSQFSEQERGTLNNLLAVEPYIPVQRSNDGTQYGKQ